MNKRFRAVIVATICSSLVCGVALFKVSSEAIIELMKGYFVIIGALCGIYGGLQSVTDVKQGAKTHENN